MSTDNRRHFKGTYRGVFRLKHSGTTHAATFYDIQWVAIEIRDVERLPIRDYSREKVGDYQYEQVLKPKSNWSFGGIDLVIIKDETTSFSEKIYDVVLVRHSKNKSGFSPLREFDSIRSTEQEYFVAGEVYFSIPPDQSSVKTIPVSSVPGVVPHIAQVDQTRTSSVPFHTDPSAVQPDPIAVPLERRRGCLTPGRRRRDAGVAVGCLAAIFRILWWLIIILLLLKLFGLFSNFLSRHVRDQRNTTDNGHVKSETPRLDPKQDTMAAQPWNYLVDHRVEWSDFILHRYDSRYTTSTYEYAASNKRHYSWSGVTVSDELMFYHDLYEDMYTGDHVKLDSLTGYFSLERRRKHLDPLSTAEMVVTFVQEIPYVLVHDGSCRDAVSQGGFVAEYHAQKRPCLPNVFAGVQSPYEFTHTLKGDCDTRSLLAYTLLDRLGIGASVWISREYGHSILGVEVPANSRNYKRVSGNRHFAVELTEKGFRIGMIAAEHTDMDNWNIVLYNK